MLNVQAGTHSRVDASGETAPSRIVLPPVPENQRGRGVAAWAEPLVIDTYLPAEPTPFPAFLETRVYQGSSGRVYPLPFHERIEHVKRAHTWQAVHLENEWVRIVVLPELGGRIHVGYDKVAGYDFFYRNNVIKPALVGLAGPWICGGVEFNWPQHHRPATFLPTEWTIEREADGAVTVWCSDHEPMTRMKGMHGIRLRPDSSLVEARVRLHNRTDETQTFLWWANVAAAVNDDYQSFFPTDVHHVADHAKRALATFPQVDGRYYGVDYPARVTADRPDGDRLDWYRNIPVPTSYMVLASQGGFFGGYDHARKAGFVHWADPAISPGKKQWTWGNAPFGWAWDANLTDGDGPYVELMAGVYTDNQPDFSWLAPGETKSFSQFWYPFQAIGPAHQATVEAAIRLDVDPGQGRTHVVVGVATTRSVGEAVVELIDADGSRVHEWHPSLGPGEPFVQTLELPRRYAVSDLCVRVRSGARTVIEWRHRDPSQGPSQPPAPATEPAAPEDIASIEELFLTGQYLQQYRHATRRPEPYWQEALRREPEDVRSNLALGARLDRAGRSAEAETLLRAAVNRLVSRAPNPADGEAYYRLGICLQRQGRRPEAQDALARAAWNAAWRVPAGWALARLAAAEGDLSAAERHTRDVLRLDAEHLGATCLLALALRGTGRPDEAAQLLALQLDRDPLDQWTRDLAGLPLTSDAPTLLDVAIDYAQCGFGPDALRILEAAATAATSTPLGQVQVGPLVHYHRAKLLRAEARGPEADSALLAARSTDAQHCLPSRLADVQALQAALRVDPSDARAEVLLGSWLYDQRRHHDAIAAWTRSLEGASQGWTAVLAHRNLGIAAFNFQHDGALAAEHFASARALAPDDAKLLHEQDQLRSRRGVAAAVRLTELERRLDLVSLRDDLTVTVAGLLTSVDRSAEAAHLLLSRRFQPWEGGEGKVLAAWDAATVDLARRALERGDSATAVAHIREAIQPPQTLGEARHCLANAAEIYWWFGAALAALGDQPAATSALERAAGYSGDFTGLSAQPYSPQTAFSVRALRALGRTDEAGELLSGLAAYADELAASPVRVDFFATSLPAMLLFHDDPKDVRDDTVATLRAQVRELRLEG